MLDDSKPAQAGGHADGLRRSVSQIAVLHIPHSSRHVPEEERPTILLDDAALNCELLRMTDAHTNELFPPTPVEAGRVILSVSRLVCDVERFPSDVEEPMADRGMGAIYTRTSMAEMLRVPPEAADRQKCLDRWYWPHRSQLECLVSDVTERSGVCLIIDCHSFPSVALPYELDQSSRRADICIGTDQFHTPTAVRDAIAAAAQAESYSVAVDAPFSGTLVPLASYRKDRRIMSVMIEVNRRLYMYENTGSKNQAFGKVCAAVGRLIVIAAQAAALQPQMWVGYFTLVSSLLVTVCFAVPGNGPTRDADHGRTLVDRWCVSCHLVGNDQKQAATDAPPFTAIAKKPGFDDAKLAFFLLAPHPKMPDMQLSRDEASDIAAYIATLR